LAKIAVELPAVERKQTNKQTRNRSEIDGKPKFKPVEDGIIEEWTERGGEERGEGKWREGVVGERGDGRGSGGKALKRRKDREGLM